MQNNNAYTILDGEFKINMKCASVLADKLTGEEKDISLSWMRRLMHLQTNDVGIKKDRNHFLKKLLEVMKQSVIHRFMTHPNSQHLTHAQKLKIAEEIKMIDETLSTPFLDEHFSDGKEQTNFMSMWSNDRRTYVAAKPIPGRGALIYMAVAEKPELGWTIPH